MNNTLNADAATEMKTLGRPPKYPWHKTAIGESFKVGLRPGAIAKEAKISLQRLASYHRLRNFVDFQISTSGRSIVATRVG